ALFEGYSFVKNNPISISMQSMLDLLERNAFDKDTETLQKFYDSVKVRASGIDNAEGKQRIIIELYDKFFKTAFPKMVERLGIVYTPVPIVDFIIHSVNDVLQKEFGRTLSDENVNILEPFTGTGTFITRLIQSGLIDKKDLERKYRYELFANEIVLLAYYIAAVNIENAYHDAIAACHCGLDPQPPVTYIPFDGICLTDTFQLGETDDTNKLFSEMFPQNSERVQRQKKTPITVIMSNPPYSRGQENANDNAQNQTYEKLENQITDTYAKESNATLSRDLYNSYMKAYRWSSDRIKNSGIIAFITGNGWIEKGAYDGFRKSLENEFSAIYVFNLRGDIRGRSKEMAEREGQNVFDIMTGVGITILVKNPANKGVAKIHYHDIGDYLNRTKKFEKINKFKSVKNIEFESIMPNEHGDWINQRNDTFSEFIPLETDKNFDVKAKSIFTVVGVGSNSGRESWVSNFSKKQIINNMQRMIDFYNEQSKAFVKAKEKNTKLDVEKFIDTNQTKISWTVNLKKDVERGRIHQFDENENRVAMYRPFVKEWFYYDKSFIERPSIGRQIFPNNIKYPNISIIVPGKGNRKDFVSLIVNYLPDYNNFDGGTQCFPLYYYEENNTKQKSIFDTESKDDYIRRDAISDFILERCRKLYGITRGHAPLSKEDIFYFVYGFLHSPQYSETFAADLKKMLPRLPLPEDVRDFWAFSKAGRKLANLHLNYENESPYYGVKVIDSKYPAVEEENTGYMVAAEPAARYITKVDYEHYRVEKMRFPAKNQKDTIIYNSRVRIENIPTEAYDYIVNGKSAIEWIMERYQIITHKESGIVNDPNDWARENNNPYYILDLLLSVINVSVQTVEIVKGLPEVKFE
ncbi:MAG: helicase, partial [Candidatus Azobacteroides sp.]|nr:helicase [Candidatus Azobacteroides sp.]